MTDKLHVSIVVPTYQEALNIEPLTKAVAQALTHYNYELIIVDDASTDGTHDKALALSTSFPIVPILRTDMPKSLSHSALTGFSKAKGEVVVLMDADLSHPPKTLTAMIEPILKDQADLCIGSRYLKQDKHPWPWYRLALSKAAGMIGALACPLSDPTTGFFAIRRSLLTKIPLNPCSWKVALEVATWCKHQRLKEIGFIFQDRIHGHSKLSYKQAFSFVKHIWRLRRIKPLPAIKTR